MDIIDFYRIEIDPISDSDIRNGYYMRSILEYEDYGITDLPFVSFEESFVKSLMAFKMYKDTNLLKELFDKKAHFDYYPKYIEPYHFSTLMNLGEKSQIVPAIEYPYVFDDTSYAFFGHEFNHCMKDVNVEERKIRDRVYEVIPMFHELLCSENESNEIISKEILKRRLSLLQLDKTIGSHEDNQIQYFNSFYYALGLYDMYKDDKNKVIILRLISRVLKGGISTLDLLEMLNIYGVNLDDKVACELDSIKEYVLK